MKSPTPSPISDQAAGEPTTGIPPEFVQWFNREWADYLDKAFTNKVTAMAWALKTWRHLSTAPTTASAPVAWITKAELAKLTDLTADAWVYWREAGHVAEPDEVPLCAAVLSAAQTTGIAPARMRVIGDNSGEDQWALGWNACLDKIAAPPANAPVASVLTDAARAIDNLKFIAKTLDASGDFNTSSRIMNAVEALAASMGGDKS